MKMYYFGTELKCAGHYIFQIGNIGGFGYTSHREIDHKILPMNLEWEAPDFTLGTMYGYQCGEWSVLHIVGSCYDKRGGCKSVFFTKGKYTGQQIFDIVSKTEIAQKMFAQMPFELKHPIIQM